MEDPLLDAGNLYPDCPGCKCSELRRHGSPPPTKLLLLMGAVTLANVLPMSVLYPFVYFMVRDFHIVENDADIGYYAGWLGSSFMAGRILTGVFWGLIADKYGRKTVMYSGLISVLVLNTLFGMSTNFWMAITTRFLLGSFNGMLGTVKGYASEICSEEHQAVGASTVSTVWGFGLIIGPAIGGYLSQPANKYPNIFPDGSLLATYPYLLQALCISAFAVFGLFACYYLPETIHIHPQEEHMQKITKQIVTAKPKSLFKNWPFMASTLLYCIWSTYDIAYTEIYSLWAVSPRASGGLGFTSSTVGVILAFSGFGMLMSQMTVFPVVAKLLGSIDASRAFICLTVPIIAIHPLLPSFHGYWMWFGVYSSSVLRIALAEAVMSGTFMLINNSVKQSQRGAANGISLSLVSIFTAIGPATGGSLFAWCQSRQNASILPGNQLVFFVLNAIVVVTGLATFEPFLPRTASKPIYEEFVY